MSNEFDLGKRMKEIIEEKGMVSSDFYKEDNLYNSEEDGKLLKSTFYSVLNGKHNNPTFSFISDFCNLAGISMEYFFRTPDDTDAPIDEAEKELIVLERQYTGVDRNRLIKSLIAYIKCYDKE